MVKVLLGQCAKTHTNKLAKSDSAYVAFLQCIDFGDLGDTVLRPHCITRPENK